LDFLFPFVFRFFFFFGFRYFGISLIMAANGVRPQVLLSNEQVVAQLRQTMRDSIMARTRDYIINQLTARGVQHNPRGSKQELGEVLFTEEWRVIAASMEAGRVRAREAAARQNDNQDQNANQAPNVNQAPNANPARNVNQAPNANPALNVNPAQNVHQAANANQFQQIQELMAPLVAALNGLRQGAPPPQPIPPQPVAPQVPGQLPADAVRAAVALGQAFPALGAYLDPLLRPAGGQQVNVNAGQLFASPVTLQQGNGGAPVGNQARRALTDLDRTLEQAALDEDLISHPGYRPLVSMIQSWKASDPKVAGQCDRILAGIMAAASFNSGPAVVAAVSAVSEGEDYQKAMEAARKTSAAAGAKAKKRAAPAPALANQNNQEVQCYSCHRYGHYANNCPTARLPQEPRPKRGKSNKYKPKTKQKVKRSRSSEEDSE